MVHRGLVDDDGVRRPVRRHRLGAIERSTRNVDLDRSDGWAPAPDERSSLNEAQLALFDRLTQSVAPWAERAGFASRSGDGRFIGPFNPSLLSPDIAARFLEFQFAEEKNSTLSERVRQVVILAVGAVWRSAYELYAHSAAARTAGLSEKAVGTLAKGGVPDELSPAERGFQTPRFSMTPGSSRRRTGRPFSPFSVGCLTPQDPLIHLHITVVADTFPAANSRGRFRSPPMPRYARRQIVIEDRVGVYH